MRRVTILTTWFVPGKGVIFLSVPYTLIFSVHSILFIQSIYLLSQRLLNFSSFGNYIFYFKKSTLTKYNLHIIKCTNLNCTTLTNVYTHVTITAIKIWNKHYHYLERSIIAPPCNNTPASGKQFDVLLYFNLFLKDYILEHF